MYRLNFDFVLSSLPVILRGLPTTLFLSVVPMLMGMIFGLALALVKIYHVPVLRQLGAVYVSFIRGTPVVVQLFLVYYGLPWAIRTIGTSIDPAFAPDLNHINPVWFALAAFSFNMAGYLSETLRAAIESVDRGQLEAAYSIGMKPFRVMMKIVFPQAALNAIPNLGNSLIAMVKDTSLAFMIMVIDIMGEAKLLGARSLRFLEIYISVSVIYWITCMILEVLFRSLEKRLSISRRGLAE
jgi:L-cystine transport system permease protein